MGLERKKQRFSSTWLTLTQLGEQFALSAREVGKYLNDTGLRTYDAVREEYLPSEKAHTEGYCTCTPTHSGKPMYMWHRRKTIQHLREQAALVPLSEPDQEARALAVDLLEAEEEAAQGNDKLYYLLFDSIPTKKLPRVMAWALMIAHDTQNPVYSSLLDSIAPVDIGAINAELARLGHALRLDEELLAE